MATKVKLTGLRKDVKGLKKQILNAVDDSNFAKSLNVALRARIRKYGIRPGLSPETRDFRRRVVSRKGPGFNPFKSSLTLSGQLLGAMFTTFKKGRVSFFRNEKSEFIFDVEDRDHKGYKIQKKLKRASSFSLRTRPTLLRNTRQLKKELTTTTGKGTSLKEIWDINMARRPVTKIFEQQKSFKLQMERRLISAIKRYIK